MSLPVSVFAVGMVMSKYVGMTCHYLYFILLSEVLWQQLPIFDFTFVNAAKESAIVLLTSPKSTLNMDSFLLVFIALFFFVYYTVHSKQKNTTT